MGAYIVLFPKARILTLIPIFFFPLFVEISAFVYIGFWFLLQLFSGTLSFASPPTAGGIAWWGHIGGFIAGIGLLPFFRRRQSLYRRNYPDETYHYISR
jgi:membrane associated rhomboid family serine protease